MKSGAPISTINQLPAPWLVLLIYSLIITMDLVYAYLVDIQFGLSSNALMALFPLLGFFYIEFSIIAAVGLYCRKDWGFSLGYIMILSGSSICSISYLIAFKLYPSLVSLFILVLISNLAALSYMITYYLRHEMNPDQND